MPINTVITLLVIGAAAGLLSGFFGIGGAVIIIPALIIFSEMTQHQAQGTALAVLSIPVALGGAINYYRAGHINLKYVLILAVAFFIGAYLASSLAVKIAPKLLNKAFALLLLVIALKMLFEK